MSPIEPSDDIPIQTVYRRALLFAAERHARKNQMLPDSHVPYTVHIAEVCMEIMVAGAATSPFDLRLAVQAAGLHDVLEDTDTSPGEIRAEFGDLVARSVGALTKSPALPKSLQLRDSLRRILDCPREIWAVKLADRITNLQKPPSSWTPEKIRGYHEDAGLILAALKDGNAYLAARLQREMDAYTAYFSAAE
ncbi:MAG: HD domain-containing protein [Methylobacteriaceae bacterium]|nr:HD domain-containing protein [Methylobacteriaceae bacterium]